MRHLTQAHHAAAAVGIGAYRKRQALHVLRLHPRLRVELQIHVVGLFVRRAPGAHRFAGYQNAQAVADLRHTQTHIGGHGALDTHLQRGLVRLGAGVQVHQTGYLLQQRHGALRDALQLASIRTL